MLDPIEIANLRLVQARREFSHSGTVFSFEMLCENSRLAYAKRSFSDFDSSGGVLGVF